MQVNLISQINTNNQPAQEKKPRKVFHNSIGDYLLYALALLFPLFFLPFTSSPAAHGKQILAAVLAFGIVLIISSDLVKKGKLAAPPTAITVSAAVFYVAVLASSILSNVQRDSILGTTPDSLFWVSAYLAVFFGAIMLAKSRKVYKSLSLFLLSGVGLLLGFVLIKDYGLHIFPWEFTQQTGFNATGGLFVPGFLAAAAFAAIVVYLLVSSARSSKFKVFTAILAGLFAFFVIKYNLWSLWLALAAGSAIGMLVIAGRPYKLSVSGIGYKSFKILVIPALVMIVSLAFAVFEKENPVPFVETFSGAEVNLSSEATWNITRDSLNGARWVYGTGPGTFPYNYNLHKPASINQTDLWSVGFKQGSSAMLTYVSTWGVAGTGLFIIFLAILFFANTRGAYIYAADRDKYSGGKNLRGIAAGAVVFAWVLAVSLFLYHGSVALHLFMFLSLGISTGVLVRAGVLKRKTLSISNSPKTAFLSVILVLFVFVFSFSALYILGQRYGAQVLMLQSVNVYQSEEDADKASRLLDKAIERDPKNDDLRRTAARILMLKFQELAEAEDLSEEEAGTEFVLAVRGAEALASSATELNSLEPQNWITLGEIYESLIGLDTEAKTLSIDAYQKAGDANPKNPSFLLAQARAYVSSADTLEDETEKEEDLKKAVEKLNESISLKQDYASARLMLASVYRRLGSLDEAIEQAKNLLERSPNDAGLVFQLGILYYENDEYEAASDALEDALSIMEGEFGNARYYLGLAKYNLGEQDAAINHFEVLAQNNPDNETIAKILDNLRADRGPFENTSEDAENTPPLEEQPPGTAEDEIVVE